MQTVPRRRGWVAWWVLAILAGCPQATTWAGSVAVGQAPGQAAAPADKDLEAAVRKVREGRNEEALAAIREQAAKHPEWPPAALILSRMLRAADQAVPARRALERAAVEAPGHPDVYLTSGTLALADGRLSDARLNFDNALALVGSGKWDAERARVFRREAFAGLAAVAEAREDGAAAQAALNAWLELEPRNGPARQRLGGVLFRLGKPDDAFAALKQAVEDAPTLEPAAVSMARLVGQKGDIKKADEWFDYAVKLEPTSARVRQARAAWLLDQGRAADARPEIEQAVKLDPKSIERVLGLQGLIAWHLRDLATAEAILEAIHRDAPADLAAANLLALCLVEQDDPAKKSRGLQLAEVNALQAARSHEAMATLGWAHYRTGQPDQAAKLLRAAVQGVRTTPDIAYFLARVLADKGQADDARKLLQSVTGLPGAFAHRDDATALLKSLAR